MPNHRTGTPNCRLTATACSTPGRAVELRQHDSAEGQALPELAHLVQYVLSRRGVHDEQALVRCPVHEAARDPIDLPELLQEIRLRVQPASCIDDQDVGPAGDRGLRGVERHGRRIAARLAAHELAPNRSAQIRSCS